MAAGSSSSSRRLRAGVTRTAALALALVGAGAAAAQQLPLVHYTTDREVRALPSAEVHSVHQDREGFLWIVVYSSGLVRYDGARMELYGGDDGLPSLAVWDVTEDAAGHLWVTSNAGLAVSEEPLAAYAHGRRVRFVTALGGTPLLDVRVRRNVTAADAEGRVWVGTDGLGVVRYRIAGGALTADTLSTAAEPGGDNRPVRAAVARRDGSVWMGLVGGTILRFEGDAAREVPGISVGQSVFALYEDPRGALWGGDRQGRLWRLVERTGALPRAETVSERLAAPIFAIRETSAGELFVASEGDGLLVLDPRAPYRQRHYTRRNGLLSDGLHALAEDTEGTVWLAQSGGLSKLRASYRAFTGYSARSFVGEPPLLPDPAVGAVQPAPPGSPCSAWAGTSGGAACLLGAPADRSVIVRAGDGLSGDYVNALLADRAGRLWVGTSAGINALAPPGVPLPPARTEQPLTLDGVRHRVASYTQTTVLSIAELPVPADDGGPADVDAVWFAGFQTLFGFVDGEWVRLREGAGLPPTVLHAVATDESGHLWVGTRDQGLYRSVRPVTLALLRAHTLPGTDLPFQGPEVGGALFEPAWTTASGAPTNQVESLLWAEGALWVATPRGLFALGVRPGEEPEVLAQLDGRTGLASPHVYSLALAPATGTLWVGTNGGLVEVDPARRAVLRTVSRADGLLDSEVWYYGSVRVGARGEVYFGTARGLSVYDPALDRTPRVLPRLHLRRAEYRGARDGHNEAVFEYAALSFARDGLVLYRTRLVGYDDAWSEPTAETKIRYTNLPAVLSPRTYRFEVIASADGAAWTPEPTAYGFRVQPPWWLQAWAFVLYAVALAVGAVAASGVQRRRILAREREQARLREAELRAEHAAAQQAAAEARAQTLHAENLRKEAELQKAHQLEEAYAHLQATQAQLIQAEKMASLGQLTAGIAHEIKNPLNFVNNFALAAVDLVGELREELADGARQAGDGSPGDGPSGATEDPAVASLLDEIALMAQKVAEHGERADRIVRSMLQHSRGSSEAFHEVELNTFVEEYLNLAYHGMRAQHTEFNVDLAREYDPEVGRLAVVPQELGRVLINLLNNAFYAVHELKARRNGQFAPRVAVRTRRAGEEVVLEVSDNGGGIPQAVLDHIFEPFFTTKPPGEGTGLGLSLSYDIITQMHHGQLRVETEEGAGSTFAITLPVRQPAATLGAAVRGVAPSQ